MDAGEADTPACRLFVRQTFLLLIAPGNGLSPPPPWDSLFPGFYFNAFRDNKLRQAFFILRRICNVARKFASRAGVPVCDGSHRGDIAAFSAHGWADHAWL